MPEPIFKSGFVALVGRPNVGKSTLMNALLGERIAAVSPKAQTTRRQLRGIWNVERAGKNFQAIFCDLPGIHRFSGERLLNKICVDQATEGMNDADYFVYLIDVTREFRPEDPESDEHFTIECLQQARMQFATMAAPVMRPLIVVLNKIDYIKSDREAFIAEMRAKLAFIDPTAIFAVSAEFGEGLEELGNYLLEQLPEHPPYFDAESLSDTNMRDIVQELVQEQLFRCLGEEIPYESAVLISRYQEPSGHAKKTEIHADIHVERTSQRRVILGEKGAKIREIGTKARERIEALIGGGVVLKLFVKHDPGWSKSKGRMKYLGYKPREDVETRRPDKKRQNNRRVEI